MCGTEWAWRWVEQTVNGQRRVAVSLCEATAESRSQVRRLPHLEVRRHELGHECQLYMVTIQQFEHGEYNLAFENLTRYLGRPLFALFFREVPRLLVIDTKKNFF